MSMWINAAVVAVAGGDPASRAFWDVVAGAVELVAIIRVVRLPAPVWLYGRWSKAAAIVVCGWLTFSLGTLVVPLGAAAVIWHTRTLVRRAGPAPEPADLPMAEGRAETDRQEGHL